MKPIQALLAGLAIHLISGTAHAGPAEDLCAAIEKRNFAALEKALALGASPNTTCSRIRPQDDPKKFYIVEHRSALSFAILRGRDPQKDETLTVALARAGADPSLPDSDELCTVQFRETECRSKDAGNAGGKAEAYYYFATLQALFEAGRDVRKDFGWKGLFENPNGSESDRLRMIELYLANGADVNAGGEPGVKNSKGLLSSALRSNSLSQQGKAGFVRRHSFTGKGSDTPAHYLRLMFEHTALINAAPVSPTLMRAFLERGVDLEFENGYLVEQVIYALNQILLRGHPYAADRLEVALMVIDAGADLGGALHTAFAVSWKRAGQESRAVIERALARGANVNSKDRSGATPIYSAMTGDGKHEEEQYALAKVRYLVGKGADLTVVSNGMTPLCFAHQRGFETVVRYLESLGAPSGTCRGEPIR